MTEKNQFERAMKATIENAEEFLRNSKILGDRGSVGHATSLAVLGFEEAHKAYLISFFLPIFDGMISEDYRDRLRSHIVKHEWKQLRAKQFRTGLELLLKTGGLSEDSRRFLGIPVLSEIEPSTEYAFSKKLNIIKNDGLYTDPFRNPIWYPLGIKAETLEAVQALASTQIESVKRIVKVLTTMRFLPNTILGSVRNELTSLSKTLRELEKEGDSSLDKLEERFSKHGEIGKIIASLALEYLRSERLRQIKREKERIER